MHSIRRQIQPFGDTFYGLHHTCLPQRAFVGKWNKLEGADAKKLWNEEIANLPEFRKENLHLISGVVLPVWDKIPTENVRIYRVLKMNENVAEMAFEGEKISDFLERMGNTLYSNIAVFSPTQIKSATDNIGTFDGNNPDIRYSLDNDIDELTPERIKEIKDQFEKDRVGVIKPAQKDVWGERWRWIAHNATRVFPDIPERGKEGTFFAEFRKMMVQWNGLHRTAQFMTGKRGCKSI